MSLIDMTCAQHAAVWHRREQRLIDESVHLRALLDILGHDLSAEASSGNNVNERPVLIAARRLRRVERRLEFARRRCDYFDKIKESE